MTPQESSTACPYHVLTRMAPARALLRRRGATTQAGFTAEKIPEGLFRRRPLLIADGPGHDQRRRELGRFFAPRAIRRDHEEFVRRTAARYAARPGREPFDLDRLALLYSVAVASRVVGLRENRIPATARRLERFFTQPPVDYRREDYGRTQRQWALAGVRGLWAVAGFYLGDVAPAIRDHRRRPRIDPIGVLLQQGAGRAEILAEAMTYATAGMVTTREFICMAAWRLLENPELRERYETADAAGRDLLLREIIRVEPVVGHLYRRVVEPIPAAEEAGENGGGGGVDPEAGREADAGAQTDDGPGRCPFRPGELVDVDVFAANRDPEFAGEEPGRIRADRDLPRAQAAGLSFGQGIHQCPGEHLALLETRLLLDQLLASGARLISPPRRSEDSLIAGYRLRGLRLVLRNPAD